MDEAPNSPLSYSCGGMPSSRENTRLPRRTNPSRVTMVPMPTLVKISRSSACGTRPSTTVARVRPPSTARRQASIFGTMPDSRVGIRSRSSVADSSVITSLLSGQSR